MSSVCRTLLMLALTLWVACPAIAHEADQFTYPPGREFADLGPYLTQYFYSAIERAVNATNESIRAAAAAGRKDEVKQLQSPEALAHAVNREFPVALFLIQKLDDTLIKPEAREHYPGQITDFKPGNTIRRYVELPLSPFNAWRCGTLKVFGCYIGADKIGHFTDMGMHYYDVFTDARRKGVSEEAALKAALKLGTDDPFFSEKGLLGWATAGAYSNADLVSNYDGFLFYRNLGEPVMLKGQVRPPMCEREGDLWKIAPHVRRDSNFYSFFISDHLDEALNPSFYVKHMRRSIRRAIEERSGDTLERFVDRFGNRESQAWFRAKADELSTYYGVYYGHLGGEKDLMNIADLCYGEEPKTVKDRDRVGRTRLHIAASRGDTSAITQLIEQGADVNARVRSKEHQNSDWGNTPLHEAARDNRVDAIRALVSLGADVNARNDRGVTPLHLASHQPEAAAMLISSGATMDVPDALGRTPLAWAAYDPQDKQARVLALLIQSGAQINVGDRDGRTPLAYAALAGNAPAASTLINSGADVGLVNRFAATALHVAAKSGDPELVDMLLKAKAPLDIKDAFGCTPLHNAASVGSAFNVALLLKAGANPQAQDEYGATPLHLASRTGREDIVTLLLQHGADVFVRTDAGLMPIDEAQKNGSAAVVALLKNAASHPVAVPTALRASSTP